MITVPEPATKRKTLAERAGETSSYAPTPSSSRTVNGSVRPTTLAGISRNPSFSSSVSSRTPSVSSRNTSGSSFASSVGPGSSRPQSAMGDRSFQPPLSMTRPATSMDTHGNVPASKRKGMHPISISAFQPTQTPSRSKPNELRRSYDNQMNYTSNWSSSAAVVVDNGTIRPVNRFREVSLSTAFHELALDPKNGPTSSKTESPRGPRTPSQLPKPVSVPKHSVTIAPLSPPRPQRSPQRSPPKIIPFLTRDSHVKAWDTKGRLEDMESLYSQLTERMDDTTNECNALKETVPIYKSRRM